LQTTPGALDRPVEYTRVHHGDTVTFDVRALENLAASRSANDEVDAARDFRVLCQ
jgi:hypothetical protein